MESSSNTDARIHPYRIDVAQDELDDLRDRLARTRWGSEIPGTGWSRGVPTDYLKALAAYWADGFDWRKAEAELNEFPQFTTEIDGQNIHFLHVRSQNPAAVPLLLLHDWPCSFVQFIEVIRPLTQDFHVIVTSTPGTGFSGGGRLSYRAVVVPGPIRRPDGERWFRGVRVPVAAS